MSSYPLMLPDPVTRVAVQALVNSPNWASHAKWDRLDGIVTVKPLSNNMDFGSRVLWSLVASMVNGDIDKAFHYTSAGPDFYRAVGLLLPVEQERE